MIDTTSEALLTLARAADELPRRRNGKKTNVSTLYRWSNAGFRGVVLETIPVGGTRCTSKEALQRFFERLSEGGRSGGKPPRGVRSPAKRQRQSERAEKELEQMGA